MSGDTIAYIAIGGLGLIAVWPLLKGLGGVGNLLGTSGDFLSDILGSVGSIVTAPLDLVEGAFGAVGDFFGSWW